MNRGTESNSASFSSNTGGCGKGVDAIFCSGLEEEGVKAVVMNREDLITEGDKAKSLCHCRIR